MLQIAPSTATRPITLAKAVRQEVDSDNRGESVRERIAATLAEFGEAVTPQRRIVHAGEVLYRCGDRFGHLYILNSGFFKIVNMSADGREKVVGLKFRGDWLGFDGIADGRYVGDAVALDTGEVWAIDYPALLAACARQPSLLSRLHEAMSREIARDRDSLMSVCTLSADARVAEFLGEWAMSMSHRGMSTDRILLRMTRAEIGNFLGLTLETVSRALSRLAKHGVIEFVGGARRDLRIPDLTGLARYAAQFSTPGQPLLQ